MKYLYLVLGNWVAGTMVACSSSVWVLAHLIPLLMHVGKQLATKLAVKKLAGVVPEADLRKYTFHSPPQK